MSKSDPNNKPMKKQLIFFILIIFELIIIPINKLIENVVSTNKEYKLKVGKLIIN